ncbi:MAG: TolC family protein [Myxococcota bacterium]
MPPPPTVSNVESPDDAGFDLSTLFPPGGLTVEQAMQRAVATAPSIERARAAAAVADAGAERAFLGVIPRLDVSARYTRLSDVDQGGIGGGGNNPDDLAAARALIDQVSDPASRTLFTGFLEAQAALGDFEFPVILDTFTLRAQVSYPVTDLFLTILPSYDGSRTLAEAERVRAQAEESSIGLQAAEAFYSLARAEGALNVAEATVAQTESNRARVEALVNGGVSPPVDLMRVDAQLASARVAVAQSQAGVAIARSALAVLIHTRPDAIRVSADLSRIPAQRDADLDGLVDQALENRAEMRALRLVVSGQEDLATAQAGRRWPQLAVQAGIDYANPNNRIFPQEQEFNATWDISAVLSWSPNDLFDANQQVASAEANVEQTRADMTALSDGVRLEVTQAAQTLEAAQLALEAATAGIEAAEESYRVRSRQLEAGTAATSDLIDAESDLTRARLQYLDSLIDIWVAEARLERAIGT